MKVHVALKRSCSERERDRRMESPQPNYGRVKGMYDHQGLADDSRWGPSLGGRTNQFLQYPYQRVVGEEKFRPIVVVSQETPSQYTGRCG